MNKNLAVAAVIVGGLVGIPALVEAATAIESALMLLWVVAVLWLTETFHITVTALLIPVLAVALGLLDMTAALENFAHPVIFLFLGGFALAAAMHVQGLDKWLAAGVLRLTRGRLCAGVVLLAAATGLLSMWISNTAITAVMLPLILGLLGQRDDLEPRTQAFSVLAIAYSANIGGIGTIIGSPPNAIVAAQLGLSFTDWLAVGLPVALALWPVMIFLLFAILRPDFRDNRVDVEHQAFDWTPHRTILIGIFLLAAAGWLFGEPLARLLGIQGSMDTWVALVVILLLAVARVATWKQIEHSADWGVLLLFGGGLTLSAVLQASGASTFLGAGLAELIGGWPGLLVLLVLVAFVVFLTEVTSNTATTALLVPVFAALPLGFMAPGAAAMAIGISASCAFMLPVATPPNALVHGTGRVTQNTMIKTGLRLNLVAVILLTVILNLLL